MSLTYALEAAVNGTTGPRATLFDGLESHQAATASIRTTTNAGDSHPAEAAAVAASGTFLRISRSIRSLAFSSLSRCSSSRSSPDSPPGRSPRSAFSSFSQLRSVTSEIPNDLASLRCGWSPSRARRIASRRNSSGYGGRVLGT